MAMTFVQTDTDPINAPCTVTEQVACSGRSVSAGIDQRECTVGGSAGSTPSGNLGIDGSGTNLVAMSWILPIAAGTTGSAGDWTVPINITTANMNLTWTECYVCRVNSSCTNQETIGSNTAVGISLSTTGVKTATVTGSAVTLSAGDLVVIVLVYTNGAMTLQNWAYTPDQNIDSPFTAALNITPSTGTLTLTGYAPSVFVLDAKTAAPGVGQLALTGFVPSVAFTENVFRTPDVGALTLTGFAPTVAKTDNVFITTDVGALTITGYAPEVSKHITVGVGELVLTGYAPSLVVTTGVQVAAGVGQLALEGHAPSLTITENVFVSADVGALTLSGHAPTVAKTDHVFITPGVGELTITGNAPTVAETANFFVNPETGALIFTGHVPDVSVTVGGNIAIDVGLGELTLSGYSPSIAVTGADETSSDGTSGGGRYRYFTPISYLECKRELQRARKTQKTLERRIKSVRRDIEDTEARARFEFNMTRLNALVRQLTALHERLAELQRQLDELEIEEIAILAVACERFD